MPAHRSLRAPIALSALALSALVAACSAPDTSADPTSTAGPTTTTSSPAPASTPPAADESFTTEEYLTGVEADIHLPPDPSGAPVIVLVHGGSWRETDRTGLTALAGSLAGDGMVVVNATHRTTSAGADVATMVGDVVCATRFAAATAAAGDGTIGPLVVVGHSSGAHLAALAALAGDRFPTRCPHPEAAIDGLVGLAGPYEIAEVASLIQPAIGASPDDDPEGWELADPFAHVAERTELPVLLVHGTDDRTLDVSFSEDFATALDDAGHPVDLEIVPGADHFTIYSPEVLTDLLTGWVTTAAG
jgi:acetyl esterase/lipase